MHSLATGILGLGLVITCMAGFRVLLFGVDLITGQRSRARLQFADILLLALSAFGLALLIAGLALLRGT